ncbi:hypothetical protein HY373_01855, partial [Candidatus Berkelbacteria bacterium]|nr:hypothetical protein [Candidatus Berkelbacteria bacterium]
PRGVEETVKFSDEEGTFQLKRKIPTGEGSLTVVPKDGGEASELTELANALRSAPPAPDSLKEG